MCRRTRITIRNYLAFCLLIILIGCGENDREKEERAIQDALYQMTNNDCDGAIRTLEEQGGDNRNSEFIATYAAAYACRAGFSEINLFANDIENLSGESTSILGSLATFSTSTETEAESRSYNDLLRAINIILYAGGVVSSSSANRAERFLTTEASSLNLQALYMTLAFLGKWFNYYGNTDEEGIKGAGDNSNNCLYQIQDNNLIALLVAQAGDTGSCEQPFVGHPDLSNATSARATTGRRICHGIVMINNMLDILANTTLSSNDSLGNLGSVFSEINTLLLTAQSLIPFDVTSAFEVMDQNSCEQQFQTNEGRVAIEAYLALFLETTFI